MLKWRLRGPNEGRICAQRLGKLSGKAHELAAQLAESGERKDGVHLDGFVIGIEARQSSEQLSGRHLGRSDIVDERLQRLKDVVLHRLATELPLNLLVVVERSDTLLGKAQRSSQRVEVVVEEGG